MSDEFFALASFAAMVVIVPALMFVSAMGIVAIGEILTGKNDE